MGAEGTRARQPRVEGPLGQGHRRGSRRALSAHRGPLVDRPGAPALLLTTTGRRSGQPRTTALYYLPDGDRQVLVASYVGDARHLQWYLNLAANPEVTVQVGSEVRSAVARVLPGDERAAIWPRLVENWPGYAGYQVRTSRDLPVIALEAPTP